MGDEIKRYSLVTTNHVGGHYGEEQWQTHSIKVVADGDFVSAADYDTLQTQRDTYVRMDAKVREALGLNDGSGRGTVETIQAMIAERDTLRAERDALQRQVREAFKAGFLAVCRPEGPLLELAWTFDGVAAADLEPQAWRAWQQLREVK